MYIPNNLEELAKQVKETGTPHRETVRTLLSWFGSQRRGSWVVSNVRSALTAVELQTSPGFDEVYIDAEIEFQYAPSTTVSPIPAYNSDCVNGEVIPQHVTEDVSDPVFRVEMLGAANRKPTSVTRDATVEHAVTLMLMNDFSQLPVMQNERNVDGIISWKSIGKQRVLGHGCEYVRDCMDNASIIDYDTTLFETVRVVSDNEVVLIKGRDSKIVGLITTSDISVQFKALSKSFLLIGEIENHIRRLINGKFSLTALQGAIAPTDENRQFQNISSLTFGEYTRFLQKPENWEKLSLDLDRSLIVQKLGEIRDIRNEVMHFHPDGISDEDLEALRDTVRLMQVINC